MRLFYDYSILSSLFVIKSSFLPLVGSECRGLFACYEHLLMSQFPNRLYMRTQEFRVILGSGSPWNSLRTYTTVQNAQVSLLSSAPVLRALTSFVHQKVCSQRPQHTILRSSVMVNLQLFLGVPPALVVEAFYFSSNFSHGVNIAVFSFSNYSSRRPNHAKQRSSQN